MEARCSPLDSVPPRSASRLWDTGHSRGSESPRREGRQMQSVRIRQEVESDHPRVREIHEAAFGQPEEADLVVALRSSAAPVLPRSGSTRRFRGEGSGRRLFAKRFEAVPLSVGPLSSFSATLPTTLASGSSSLLHWVSTTRVNALILPFRSSSWSRRFSRPTAVGFAITKHSPGSRIHLTRACDSRGWSRGGEAA